MKISLKNATLKIKDGTAVTPKEVTVKIGDGNMTWEEKRNMEYILDRGVLASVREGDDVPVDVRFDFWWEELRSSTGDTTPTPYEALKKYGAASAWVSTSADPCEPYAVDLEFTYSPPCGSAEDQVVLFSDFRYESLSCDPKAGTVACTGKANITAPTLTRV